VPVGVLCWAETVIVDVELGPTEEGKEAVGPLATTGEIVAWRFTFALKPLRPVTVIVNVVDEPFRRVWDKGKALIVKSGNELLNMAP
jgi:hypothetical protein